MFKSLLLPFLFIALALSGCYKTEYEKVKRENDSLRSVLETNLDAIRTLQEVKELMDSIDVNRYALRTELHKGTTFQDVATRMQQINRFVKQSEEKIDILQKSLEKSETNASGYVMMIDALKGELEF